MSDREIKKSFVEVWRSFKVALQYAHKLAPLLVVTMGFVIVFVVYICLTSPKLMMGMVLLVVLGITVLVYANKNDFGEAALALVAGLLTAYSVTWTPGKFVAFIAVWSAFLFLAMLISSVKIAAKVESTYRQAAIALAKNSTGVAEKEKQLRAIGDRQGNGWVSPTERAEILLILSYRNLAFESMEGALDAVETLSVVTQIDYKEITQFVADAYKAFEFVYPDRKDMLVDMLYKNIKEAPVSPVDYIDAFAKSRSLVLSEAIAPDSYLALLNKSLELGTSPDYVIEYIKEHSFTSVETTSIGQPPKLSS